mgnify:CR=1 FL=1
MEENNNDNQNNVQENSASKEDKPSFLDNAKLFLSPYWSSG